MSHVCISPLNIRFCAVTLHCLPQTALCILLSFPPENCEKHSRDKHLHMFFCPLERTV